MEKLKKLSIKSLAVLLSILMIISIIPATTFAEIFYSNEQSNNNNYRKEEKEIFEIEELREESVKHFRLEDGTCMAVQYDEPVHYLDNENKWQNINNTLNEINSNEYATYDSHIKFAKIISENDNLITISDENGKIAIRLDSANEKVIGQVVDTSTKFSDNATKLQKIMTLDNLISKILYSNILDGVDIEYIVDSNNIKENIIIKTAKDSYNYNFSIDLDHLEAELFSDGSICIYNKEKGDTVYSIPKGYMYDANGNYSESVTYSLTKNTNGTYKLCVSADSSWINENDRAFPVTIDPPIFVSSTVVTDTYINSYSPSQSAGTYERLYAGNTTQLYWKASTLPSLPNDAYITNAVFQLLISDTTTNITDTADSFMGAFPVLTNWDNSLTWNDYISTSNPKGTYNLDGYTDFNVVHVVNGYVDIEWVDWNVTDIVKDWYNGTLNNYGITISDINRGTENYSAANIKFYATHNNNPTDYHPKFYIIYKDMRGIEDYWTTTSQNAGLAGTGYVNNATGTLMFSIGTISTTDSLMPYTPTLIYNSAIADYSNKYTNAEVPYITSPAGYGFKWNMNESIVERQYLDYQSGEYMTTYYVWSDADGTEHYFAPYTNDSGITEYRDEDGLQMKLTVGSTYYTITDISKTVRRFNRTTSNSSYIRAGGTLEKITDINGNYIDFSPNEYGRISSIKLVPYNGSEITMLKVAHNSSGKVNRILNETTQQAAIFYYSENYNDSISPYNNGYLRKIVYAHQTGSTSIDNWYNFMQNGTLGSYITVDATALYTYDSSGRLLTALDDLSKYQVTYEYTGDKVASVTEKAGNNLTTGQKVTFTYNSGYTDIRTSGKDDIINNSDDIITRYIFDDEGRTTSAYSMDVNGTTIYGASNGIYNSSDESKNSIRVSSYVSDSAANCIVNGGFENSTAFAGWYRSGTTSRTTLAKYSGIYGAKINGTSTSTGKIYQYTTLSAGSYTLSLNINTNNCSGATVKLIAQSVSNSANTFTEIIPVDEYAASGAYAFASLNFNVTASSEVYKITIQITGASSSTQYIMVDNVMLAKSVGVSPYSMVEFGNFEDDSVTQSGTTRLSLTDYWTFSDTTDISVNSVGGSYGKTLKIVGRLNQNKSATQTIFSTSSSTALTSPKIYKISGFAKSDRIMRNSTSRFALKAEVYYFNETEPQIYWFDFPKSNVNAWQFVSGTFDVCANGGAVQKIDVSCVYDYQSALGTAYFDNITVVEVRDGSAESYTYYDSGMPKTYDNGGYKEWYFYADNNTSAKLTRKITSTNGVTDYTYDSKDRIVTEVYYEYSGEYTGTLPTLTPKVKTTYTYNSYGLITNTTMRTVRYSGTSLVDTNPSNIISTSKTYNTTSGSRIFGSLKTETDSLGHVTRYFYNTSTGKLTFVVNPDENSGLAYTYDALGNLTLVEPVTYSNSTPSAQTNAESVEYTYSQNKLTQIKTESTTYTLSYDAFGNSTGVQAGSHTLANYTYNSNNGKLNTISYGNGFVVEYVYDNLDRVSETWYTNSVGPSTLAYSYEYDANGNMCKFIDSINGRTYRYKYDDQGRMTGFVESAGNTNLSSSVSTYDEQSRIHTLAYSQDYSVSSSSANLITKYVYSYNDNSSLSDTTLTSGNVSFTFTPSYDALERMSSRSVAMTTASGTITNATTYGFTSNNTNRSLQISQFVSSVGNNSTTYNYTYDANGNITEIKNASGVIQNKYYYDDLGQLIREDNRATGYSYTYSYSDSQTSSNNAGNIKSKSVYTFTTGTLGTALSTYNYTYGDSTWHDLLTAYNGQTITYDTIGNPTAIGSNTFTWTGRQLTGATVGSNTMTFAYNDEGIRLSKTVNGVEHIYTVSGMTILSEQWGNNLCVYLYDENGSPIGMKYRTSSMTSGTFYNFLFEKNLQGDIVAIYNQSGTKVRTYTYDAWGNCTVSVISSSGTNAYAQYNPFRYRGYYYDTDLGMYYLNTRYYTQQWGRFLNADGIGFLGVNSDLLSYNLYTYCGNNPILGVDPEGTFNWGIFLKGVSIALVGITAIATVVTAGCAAPALAAAVAVTSGIACIGFGVAEIAESVTDYNVIRDGLMGGNEQVYEAVRTSVEIVATVSTIAVSASAAASKAANPISQCFVAGTPVQVENGTVPIEMIAAGMLVWSSNPDTRETELKQVVQTFQNETTELVHVTVDEEEIVCTNEHPFYSPVKGWISAIDLRAGDILVTLNGEYVIVEQVQHELLETPVATYNFEVENFHTYYVGINKVLVHNACAEITKIDSYANLRKEAAGTGNEVHHIIEKRFAKSLNLGNTNNMGSVILSKSQHAIYTKAWRKALSYGHVYSAEEVWRAAKTVYANAYDLLNYVAKTIR